MERSNSNYYHITARSNNREFFFLPILNAWDIMTRKLSDLQAKHDIKISAFVLMNNHFHLLILTPKEDIDRIMYFFMKEVTLEIQKQSGRINKIFGGRYKGSMITNFGHLVNVYKYIYRNPLEVGISDKAQSSPYSTFFFQHQSFAKMPFKLEKILPPHAFKDFENLDEITWINTRYTLQEAASIKRGLHKTVFAYEKHKSSGRSIEPIVIHPKKKTQEELRKDMFPEENMSCGLYNIKDNT